VAGGSRHFGFFATATVLVIVIGAGSARAADSACKASFSATPNELLALPGSPPDRQGVPNDDRRFPAGVECTWEGLHSKPPDCDSHATIEEDRKIADDRRLIVVNFSWIDPESSSAAESLETKQSRLCIIFGCFKGRISKVFRAEFGPKTKIQYAGAEKLTLSDPGYTWASHQKDFFWRSDWRDYIDYEISPEAVETPSPVDKISCSKLPTMDAGRLSGDKLGCVSLEDDAPEAEKVCDWDVSVSKDQSMGEKYRVIDIRWVHNTSAWSGRDEIYVFACVDGGVETIFDNTFEFVRDIDFTSPHTLVLETGDCALPSRDGLAGCPTRELRLTYLWNPPLSAYVLRSVHIRPFGGSSDEESSLAATPSAERNKNSGMPDKSYGVRMPLRPAGN
jgi:hypothetical protein